MSTPQGRSHDHEAMPPPHGRSQPHGAVPTPHGRSVPTPQRHSHHHREMWIAQRHSSHHGSRSSPLAWAVAVVFTVLAVLLLAAALLVLVVVLVVRPRQPYLTVESAHLDALVYDQLGTLDVGLALTVTAANDNAGSGAAFAGLRLSLRFEGVELAELRAARLEVGRKGRVPLGYVVRSAGVPLDAAAMAAMDAALKGGVVALDVGGRARTEWKVGVFVPVAFWTHLSCRLRFFWPNGTALLPLDCTSKTH